jgi:hypothetical protein
MTASLSSKELKASAAGCAVEASLRGRRDPCCRDILTGMS